MRRRFVLLFILLSVSAFAKNRDWKDADVLKITTQTGQSGTAVAPIGNVMVGVPIVRVTTYYYIGTAEVVYILWTNNRKPLNITLHGKTKIAIEGDKAHILDDAGKDVKLDIAQKVLRKDQSTDDAPKQ